MQNFVIESLNPKHGKEIIKYIRSLGIDVGRYIGSGNKKSGHRNRFYGVINGKFVLLNNDEVAETNTPIITLSTIPKRGDWVYVSDDIINFKDKENLNKRIFITKINGSVYPIITVIKSYEENFKNDKPFKTNNWKYMIPIPEEKKYNIRLSVITLTGIQWKCLSKLTQDDKIYITSKEFYEKIGRCGFNTAIYNEEEKEFSEKLRKYVIIKN